MDQLFLRQPHPPELNIPELHQAVLFHREETFHFPYKLRRLFPMESLVRSRIRKTHHPLQMVISVFTVSRRIFQLPVCEKVKAHLPDIFLSQLRKDM